jgi:hypothetical protein
MFPGILQGKSIFRLRDDGTGRAIEVAAEKAYPSSAGEGADRVIIVIAAASPDSAQKLKQACLSDAELSGDDKLRIEARIDIDKKPIIFFPIATRDSGLDAGKIRTRLERYELAGNVIDQIITAARTGLDGSAPGRTRSG